VTKKIRLKHTRTCTLCGAALKPGQMALWEPGIHLIRCIECANKPAPEAAPEAPEAPEAPNAAPEAPETPEAVAPDCDQLITLDEFLNQCSRPIWPGNPVGQTDKPSEKLASMAGPEGWPSGLARMRDIVATGVEIPSLPSLIRSPCWSVDGDELDRDRLETGHQDAYRATRRARVSSQSRFYRIYYNGDANACHTDDQYLWRGAIVLAITDMLESAGGRVEIIMISRVYGLGGSFPAIKDQGVVIKSHKDDLSPEQIAFWVGHRGVLSYYVFRWEDSFRRTSRGGAREIASSQHIIADEPHVFIDGFVFDRKTAQRFIDDLARKLG